ncbi:hypothetical protein QOZ80_5AG0401500 [Eleusine coracana subsp. coracana]|nr:hypothetical protein QOZ80_5AG0401500 [Eleusine coracana subsp. coracana]
MELGQEAPRPRVIILCSPCMGHLIPLVELARRLVTDHGLAATLLFTPATPTPSQEYLAVAAMVPDGIDLVTLPGPPADALPPSASVRECLAHAIVSNIPRAHQIIQSLAASAPIAAMVVDVGFKSASGIAAELGVPVYMYFPSTLTALSLIRQFPELDATITGEFRDATEPIRLPGCMPIMASDLPSPMLADRSSEVYAKFLHGAREYSKVDGFLVNSFPELEPAVVNSVSGLHHQSVHAIGPLVWTRPAVDDKDHECIKWLDRQPSGSVVYVSLGSGGTLTWQQTAELALGLEMSQRRFIWVVKRPDDDPLGCGSFFGGRMGVDEEVFDFLPEGFVERTREVGLLVPSWAPQTAILSHSSIGCFITHCGWNSVLEGLLNGIPLIAWPLYAEQRINAAMLEGQLGVATRVKLTDGGLVLKEEVARAITCAMLNGDGETLRKKIHKLQNRALHALSSTGSSVHAVAQLSDLWKSGSWQI